MIKKFYDDFDNENYIVKIQVINASIKNFLKNPDDKNNEVLVSEILTKASENNNPDVRDRCYFYWRLLENDPDLAKEMICSEKKSFDDTIKLYFWLGYDFGSGFNFKSELIDGLPKAQDT